VGYTEHSDISFESVFLGGSKILLKDSRSVRNFGYDSAFVKNVYAAEIPTIQSVVNAFDNDPLARSFHDVGLDGLSDSVEETFFSDYFRNSS